MASFTLHNSTVVGVQMTSFLTSNADATGRKADPEGDFLVAWLRECHREIHDDIDTTDPQELCGKRWAHSETSGKRYDLRKISIPGFGLGLKFHCRFVLSRIHFIPYRWAIANNFFVDLVRF